MTAWTSDSGASASAATWKIQAPSATAMPIANHLERNERDGAGQRVAQIDVRRGDGPTVLEQEAQVGREGAGERQQDSDFECHEKKQGDAARAAPPS